MMRPRDRRGVLGVLASPEVAFYALVVFLGGIVVAPLGHLIGHRDDHRHGPAGVIAQPDDDLVCAPVHEEPSRARRAFTHGWERQREARAHAAAHDHCGMLADRAADAPKPTDSNTPPHKSTNHGAGALQHFGVSLLTSVAIDFVAIERIDVAVRAPASLPEVSVARRHRTPGSARAPPA